MRDKTLVSGHFNTNLARYWLWSTYVTFCFNVMAITLLLSWFPLSILVTKRYITNMSAQLIEQKRIVRANLLTNSEHTDRAFIQAHMMHIFGLVKLSVNKHN
jgi:hypothetical protein